MRSSSPKTVFFYGFLLIIFTLWLISWTVVKIFENHPGYFFFEKKDLLSAPWPQEVNFCGERAPIDRFYIRPLWERDYLLNLENDFQSILYLKRSKKFFPYIEAELERRGMPDDLKYLAVAESALIEQSYSSAGAAGIWQFIPGTGRAYGLQVDEMVDERLHFEKATDAALDYLQKLHDDFGSWSLAAAAYNAGENQIASRIKAQEVNSYYDLYVFPETSRYVIRILAIKEIMSQPEKYNYKMEFKDYYRWPAFRDVTVEGPIANMSKWAQEQGSNYRLLREMNPWILGDTLPEGTWTIKVVSEDA